MGSEGTGSGLERKTALITGAAGGIGAATARRLAEAGAKLVLIDRDEEGLKEIELEVGGLAIAADVAEEKAVERAMATARERYCGVDLLHNNAGVTDRKASLWETSLETYERVMAINARGGSTCAQSDSDAPQPVSEIRATSIPE